MRILTSLIFCGALVACGNDDGDNKNPAEELVDAGFNLAKQAGLPGTEWSTECTGTNILNADVIQASSQEIWTFNAINTDVTRNFVIYSDDTCQEPIGELEILGNYELEKEMAENQNPINLSFDKAYLTASSETLLDALNAVSFCGIENWEGDKKTDITATVGQGLCQIPENLGKKSFDVVLIEDKNLYFGTPLTAAPTLEEQRPTDADRTIGFMKK